MNRAKLYNKTNNSFKKKLIFHVGTGAGFYSEINGMLRAMLYCYANRIKFVLYADDASFAGGNGWNEFFMPFCTQNHDKLNRRFNLREKKKNKRILYVLGGNVLKIRNNADYLTYDIFGKACLGVYSKETTNVCWNELGIDGNIDREFVKLSDIALRYNKKTFIDIKEKIKSINLPKRYHSIQLRGGDKSLEVKRNIDIDCVIDRIKEMSIKINNLFVFTDDFQYIRVIREKHPEWNIYTLTRENECGYDNNKFNEFPWSSKRNEIIKLLAMVEVCLNSEIHFGCEIASVNDYIKNMKPLEKYIPIWTKEDAQIKEELISDFKAVYL